MKKFGIWFIIQLTLIFMKLCEVITWSWAGVLIPLWGALSLILAGFIIGLITE